MDLMTILIAVLSSVRACLSTYSGFIHLYHNVHVLKTDKRETAVHYKKRTSRHPKTIIYRLFDALVNIFNWMGHWS
jgi:hypothetical protein